MSIILSSIQSDNSCPYILTNEDLELLKKIVYAQQIALWSFRKAEEGDIGSFVPVAIMHETKRLMVEEKSREVNKRLSSALKKLLELHEKENKKSAADSDKRI